MENFLVYLDHIQFVLILACFIVTFWFDERKWKYLMLIFSWHFLVVTTFILFNPILGLLCLLNSYLSIKGYDSYKSRVAKAKEEADI